MNGQLRNNFDEMVLKFNCPEFITGDPISVPHSYTKKQDIEISAFWTAMLSWGQRPTIISKSKELFNLMGPSPYDFVKNHSEIDRKPFLGFKHRTFQPTDTLYFLEFFQWFYEEYKSLEDGFLLGLKPEHVHVGGALTAFHTLFFSRPYTPARTKKHVPTPRMNSACKKLNLFLRWMVRTDDAGVDFGIWNRIKPSQLLIPLDVHVERIARKYGLLKRKQADWQAVLELTEKLREWDVDDPVKYDYALFGIGVLEKNNPQTGYS